MVFTFLRDGNTNKQNKEEYATEPTRRRQSQTVKSLLLGPSPRCTGSFCRTWFAIAAPSPVLVAHLSSPAAVGTGFFQPADDFLPHRPVLSLLCL